MYFCASGDPVIGHDLLELVLVARVAERVRWRVGEIAGAAVDVGVVAAQVAAAVEIPERDVVVRGGGHSRVRVFLVGERFVAEALDRVRDEHRADPVRARVRPRRRGGGDEKDAHGDRDAEGQNAASHYDLPLVALPEL